MFRNNDNEIDDMFANSSGGFAADESIDDLENDLAKISPAMKSAITKNIKNKTQKAEELFDNLMTPEIIEHNMKKNESSNGDGAILDNELKQDIMETVAKLIPDDSQGNQDGFENVIKEDYLINKNKINRDDPKLGTIEIDGKNVGRRIKDIDESMAKTLIKHVVRLVSPDDLGKELLIRSRKKEIEKLLLDVETYSRYRHKFIDEMYANILGKLPKLLKTKYGEGFLREAFMVIHVIYKFGNGAETLDPDTIAEIICKHNDILPSIQIYDEKFTVDLFLELAKEGVFKKIQKLCNEDIIGTQLTDMTSFLSQKMDSMRLQSEGGKFDSKELKELTDMLTKIQTMSNELESKGNEERIAYVYNDQSVGIDYSKLIDLEEIDPSTVEGIGFDFKYYIMCYDKDENDKDIFKGWLVYDETKRKYVASMSNIKIWDIRSGDTTGARQFINLINKERSEGEYTIYKIKKMYNDEVTLEERLRNE